MNGGNHSGTTAPIADNAAVDTARNTSETVSNKNEETYKDCHAVKGFLTLRIGENPRVTLLRANGSYDDGPKLECHNRHVKINGAYASTTGDVTTFKYDITLDEGFKGPATISYGNVRIKIDKSDIKYGLRLLWAMIALTCGVTSSRCWVPTTTA